MARWISPLFYSALFILISGELAYLKWVLMPQLAQVRAELAAFVICRPNMVLYAGQSCYLKITVPAPEAL